MCSVKLLLLVEKSIYVYFVPAVSGLVDMLGV